MKPNPYEAIPAVITETIDETPLIRTLRLKPDRPIPFRTGQFIELGLPGVGEGPSLRRPLTSSRITWTSPS